jgi:hypothetical protein
MFHKSDSANLDFLAKVTQTIEIDRYNKFRGLTDIGCIRCGFLKIIPQSNAL